MIQNWQNIYSEFNVVAFTLFDFKVYWYGIMYVLALLVALFIAKYFVKKINLIFQIQCWIITLFGLK